MSIIDRIEKERLRDLLGKGWLSHDGMWFLAVLNELGIEAANRLNRSAIESLAPVELRRYLKEFGGDAGTVVTTDGVYTFMKDALDVVLPSSVRSGFGITMTGKDRIGWEWKGHSCFAYQGMKMLGVESEYQCGVIYRIECWLKVMGIHYTVSPEIDRCLIPLQDACRGEFVLKSLQ